MCRIVSVPKARSILLNGAVRKGERLVPPSAFDLFMRAAFPVSNARVKVCSVISPSFVYSNGLCLTVCTSNLLGN
jgi:hypothetical protein